MALHERDGEAEKASVGSDRNFGLVFAAFFGIIGGIRFWRAEAYVEYFLTACAISLAVALLRPGLLHVPNLLWYRFGMLLHKIVSPVVMCVLFFGSVLPVGLALRLQGKRPLSLDFDHTAESYWIAREPPGPNAASYTRQY